MSNKKLDELQKILESNNKDSLNKFIIENKTKTDQIFLEYVLKTRPNSNILFQTATQRIQDGEFNLHEKEEHYVRKLIQYMEKHFMEETGALELFQTFFNTNPQKKNLLIYLTSEISKMDGDVYFYYFAILFLGLKTGMGNDWSKFYQVTFPIWMEKLEYGMDDDLVFRVLTNIVNDEEKEKTKKFQMVYKKFERFLKSPFSDVLEFVSTFSNELTEKQIMMYVKFFQKVFSKELIPNVSQMYLKIFKSIMVNFPNKSDETLQK
jgi:hypothetical protein